jgi:hypothetical protein
VTKFSTIGNAESLPSESGEGIVFGSKADRTIHRGHLVQSANTAVRAADGSESQLLNCNLAAISFAILKSGMARDIMTELEMGVSSLDRPYSIPKSGFEDGVSPN